MSTIQVESLFESLYSPNHANLECPECGRLCRPQYKLKGGGASYLCRNKNAHADFRDLRFKIDGLGELHF